MKSTNVGPGMNRRVSCSGRKSPCGEVTTLRERLQKHVGIMLRRLPVACDYYLSILDKHLLDKAQSVENLERWHEVARNKIHRIKFCGILEFTYKQFLDALPAIIAQAASPGQLAEKIDEWRNGQGIPCLNTEFDTKVKTRINI